MKYSSSPKKLPNGTCVWLVDANSSATAATRTTTAPTRRTSSHFRSSASIPSTAHRNKNTIAMAKGTVIGDRA
jgi:hypothetical protein